MAGLGMMVEDTGVGLSGVWGVPLCSNQSSVSTCCEPCSVRAGNTSRVGGRRDQAQGGLRGKKGPGGLRGGLGNQMEPQEVTLGRFLGGLYN